MYKTKNLYCHPIWCQKIVNDVIIKKDLAKPRNLKILRVPLTISYFHIFKSYRLIWIFVFHSEASPHKLDFTYRLGSNKYHGFSQKRKLLNNMSGHKFNFNSHMINKKYWLHHKRRFLKNGIWYFSRQNDFNFLLIKKKIWFVNSGWGFPHRYM